MIHSKWRTGPNQDTPLDNLGEFCHTLLTSRAVLDFGFIM